MVAETDRIVPATPLVVRPVCLREGDVSLVPLGPEHADGLAAAAGDGRLWELNVTSVPAPGEELAYIELARSTPDREPFAVLDGAGTVLGSTSYHDILAAPRRLEIGYTWYAKSLQRTALNTTCKRLLLRHAFDVLGCLTVGWRTDGENYASQRAIERLGAQRDGAIRGNALRRDGSVRDTVMYSVTASEWPGVRRRLDRFLGLDRSTQPASSQGGS